MSTITPIFREQVERGLGCVVILAGSGSDDPQIKKVADALLKYGVPYEVRIASAHKQGDRLREIVAEYDSLNGPLAYIAVAGGTDALSGTSSFISYRPTISCPPDAPNMSCLTNPPGSSNLYITRPENAARAVAQIFSYANPAYRAALTTEIEKKRGSLVEDDTTMQIKYASQGKPQ